VQKIINLAELEILINLQCDLTTCELHNRYNYPCFQYCCVKIKGGKSIYKQVVRKT
jgi:hypothetical protein